MPYGMGSGHPPWGLWEEGMHGTRVAACMQFCSSQWALRHTIVQVIDEGARGWTREAALGDGWRCHLGGQEELPWEMDGSADGRNRQEKETWEELEGGRWSGRVLPRGQTKKSI